MLAIKREDEEFYAAVEWPNTPTNQTGLEYTSLDILDEISDQESLEERLENESFVRNVAREYLNEEYDLTDRRLSRRL